MIDQEKQETDPRELYPSLKGDPENEIEVVPGEPGQEPTLSYPSMEGIGLEEVTIPRPLAFGPHVAMTYESLPLGEDVIPLKDAIPLISKAINERFREGDYQILSHYAGILEGSEFFDQALMPQVRAFVEEAKGVKTPEEAQNLLNRVNTFLGNLKMQKVRR